MGPTQKKLPQDPEGLPPKPEKYIWKRSYTLVLIANVAYILLFYVLMNLFT